MLQELAVKGLDPSEERFTVLWVAYPKPVEITEYLGGLYGLRCAFPHQPARAKLIEGFKVVPVLSLEHGPVQEGTRGFPSLPRNLPEEVNLPTPVQLPEQAVFQFFTAAASVATR